MKHTAIILILLSTGFPGFQHRYTDFSGTWALDMKKSQNLAPSFKSVTSFRMNVQQTNDSIIINRHMSGSGQTLDLPPLSYRFGGPEVFREDTLRGTKHWTTAAWETTGQKFIVNDRTVRRQGEKEQHYTQTEVWQFGKKNMLMILLTQKFDEGDSTHTERRYYRRVE